MRQFTSLADREENDELFEAVLREQFELEQDKLMEKNQALSEEIMGLRDSLLRQKGDNLAYIERLKIQMIAISNNR